MESASGSPQRRIYTPSSRPYLLILGIPPHEMDRLRDSSPGCIVGLVYLRTAAGGSDIRPTVLRPVAV